MVPAARSLSWQSQCCGMHTSDSLPYSGTAGDCLCGCLRGCHGWYRAGALCIPIQFQAHRLLFPWALHLQCLSANTGPVWLVHCEELVGTCWLGVAGGGRSGVECTACARKHVSAPQLASASFHNHKWCCQNTYSLAPGRGAYLAARRGASMATTSLACGRTLVRSWWDRGLKIDLRQTTQQQTEKQNSRLPSLRRLWQAPEQVRLVLDSSERTELSAAACLLRYQLVQGTRLWRTPHHGLGEAGC